MNGLEWKRKIKVIHFVDKFGIRGASVHGVSRLFSWWIPRFDRASFEVRLIGLRNEGCSNLVKQGIEVSSLNRSKFDFSTVIAVKHAIETFGADIVHLHGYGAANFGRIAAHLAGAKAIVHEHFVDPNLPWYQIPFDKGLARWTSVGIANCRSVKDFMIKRRFLAPHQVQVVFNGVPLADFQPASEKQVLALRRKWGFPPARKIIATIGRLDEQKGNQFFLEAAAAVLHQHQDIAFLLVGDGPLLEELREQSRRLGIERQVLFAGFQNDIASVLSAIDMLVIPSLYEGTTLTVFEAMCMQVPIVSTDVDGLREVLIHDRNSLLVSPSSGPQLASAIQALLADPDKAARLARQAKQDSYRFEIQKTIDEIQQIYTDTIASG